MIIVQMTDLHVVAAGTLLYGEYDTNARLERAVAHVNAMAPRPDVVVLTGDLVDKGTVEEYELLRSMLDELAVPYFPIAGNHDVVGPLLDTFGHIDELPDPGVERIDYVIDRFDVRLVALDSNRGVPDPGDLSADQLEWLDGTLAEQPDRRTIVMVHHPPFLTGVGWLDGTRLAAHAELEAIVSRHPQVGAVLSGHVHRQVQAAFGGTIAMTSPSTAAQFALGLGGVDAFTLTDEDPAVLVHAWPENGRLASHRSVIADDIEKFVPPWARNRTA